MCQPRAVVVAHWSAWSTSALILDRRTRTHPPPPCPHRKGGLGQWLGGPSFKEREGKGSKWRSANRRRQLQTRTTNPRRHANPNPPPPPLLPPLRNGHPPIKRHFLTLKHCLMTSPWSNGITLLVVAQWGVGSASQAGRG